jgi:hypothetical protein
LKCRIARISEVTVSNAEAEFNPLTDAGQPDDEPEGTHMRMVSRKLIQGLREDASYPRVEDRNMLQLRSGLN